MKIIQVIPYFCFGGAEIMCENLTYALRRMGHQVSVVSLYDAHTPISRRMEDAGVSITYLDKRLGLDVSMVPKLEKIFRKERPDVVHTHLDVIKYAVPAAKLAGVKRCVHTVHSVAQKEAEGRIQKVINKTFYRGRLATPVALSPEVQRTVLDFYGLKEDDVPVIYNGIDLSCCVPKADYATGERVELVHVGRFDAPKNHEGLLKAFARLHEACPNTHLTMVGDGDLREPMEALAKELGIWDWVCFAGMQPNVHPYLEKADIFLLPSNYEGIPMTILEAMATGLPIVATAVGGVPDLLTDGQTGLIVPCQQTAVAEACRRLVTDPALRKKLGRGAQKTSPRFSADHMAQSYTQVYSH